MYKAMGSSVSSEKHFFLKKKIEGKTPLLKIPHNLKNGLGRAKPKLTWKPHCRESLLPISKVQAAAGERQSVGLLSCQFHKQQLLSHKDSKDGAITALLPA